MHLTSKQKVERAPVDQSLKPQSTRRSTQPVAAVNLEALRSALAQVAEKSSVENIAREVASNPVVLAVMVGALRYVKRRKANRFGSSSVSLSVSGVLRPPSG